MPRHRVGIAELDNGSLPTRLGEPFLLTRASVPLVVSVQTNGNGRMVNHGGLVRIVGEGDGTLTFLSFVLYTHR